MATKDGKSGKKAGPAGAAAVMGQNVRKMGSPIYNVTAGGVTVDWTDKIGEAVGSFDEASTYPKQIWEIGGKSIRLMRQKTWSS